MAAAAEITAQTGVPVHAVITISEAAEALAADGHLSAELAQNNSRSGSRQHCEVSSGFSHQLEPQA